VHRAPSLAEHTTLRVGGPARAWVVAETEQQVIDVVRACDAAGEPLLVLGGGSNILAGDAGFPGTVLQVAVRGLTVEVEGRSATLGIMAGEPWDDVVSRAVGQGWSGIEALSGIPGLAGATPVQNVGAYGQEVSQVVTGVRAWDRLTGRIEHLGHEECRFEYRSSVFKQQPGRWVVLSVAMMLRAHPAGTVRYAELAAALGVAVGAEADVRDVRNAVIALRRRKGMVLDESDHDTWSAGSFFTNPVVDRRVAGMLPADCPRYPSPRGVKLSAAWLIERSGVARGHRSAPGSMARVSSKHTLALTNAGGASADDVLELARDIRARVVARFGIELEPEVDLVGCTLQGVGPEHP
jgi:UDP-N-acetylmuramate dehydrogenase